MPNEDYAVVLDYLQKGKSDSYKSEPLAQIIGTSFYTLLEVVPKQQLKVLEKVYIGREERDKISLIKKRIAYKELTSTAVAELEKAVELLVTENEKKYIEFYNTCSAITIKRHKLELLPGFGKKHMLEILSERQKKPFESFQELSQRIPSVPDPRLAIVKRIVEELKGEDPKHYLFVRPPSMKDDFFPRRQ